MLDYPCPMNTFSVAILFSILVVIIQPSLAENNADRILLESFDQPLHTWEEMNDPVMGGKSRGTFTIQDGIGKFEGEVVDVPFLHAPGFIQVRTQQSTKRYPDVSSCTGLEIVAKQRLDSNNEEGYQGYRISFGNAHAPGGKYFAYGYKSNLKGVPSDDFGAVTIPFGEFTDFWDDATGDAIHTCLEDQLYCPDEMTLKNMGRMAIWGEGVAGNVSLEIKSITAVGCAE